MSKKGHRRERADDMILVTRVAIILWEIVREIMTNGSIRFVGPGTSRRTMGFGHGQTSGQPVAIAVSARYRHWPFCCCFCRSPIPYEGSPPSPCSTGLSGTRHRRQRRTREKIGSDEKDHARAVLAASAGEWRAQRSRAPVPGCTELARVEAMAALALRHVPRSEVIQLLTWHVASARDLPGLLAWRLRQV